MDYQNRCWTNWPTSTDSHSKKANDILTKARARASRNYISRSGWPRHPKMEIHPGVTPKPGETVLTKQRVGPFTTTNLNEISRNWALIPWSFSGFATQGCILTTVRCAWDMDYKLVVGSDCCANPAQRRSQPHPDGKDIPGSGNRLSPPKKTLAMMAKA